MQPTHFGASLTIAIGVLALIAVTSPAFPQSRDPGAHMMSERAAAMGEHQNDRKPAKDRSTAQSPRGKADKAKAGTQDKAKDAK